MSFLEDCRQLIGIDSTPSQGSVAVAEFLGRLCREGGLSVDMQMESVDGVQQCNILARPQEEAPAEEVVFQTHLDTGEAGHFGHWTQTQSNPFNASIYSDSIYGLGAADCKLDFLCKLEAAKSFVGKKLNRPFVLVGTFAGKSGMSGALRLIRRKKLNAKLAFVGQPTQMRLVTGGLGHVTVEISIPFSDDEVLYRREHDLAETSSSQSKIFSGKVSEAASESAIVRMLSYLSQLPEGLALLQVDGGTHPSAVPMSAVLEFDTIATIRDPIFPRIGRVFRALQVLENELKTFRDEKYSPPYPTLNVGSIRTRETDVTLTGVCALPPSVPDSTYETWMRALAAQISTVGATFRVTDYRKGFEVAGSSTNRDMVQEILKQMGLDSVPVYTSAVTEASVFSRLGIECLVWGPGQRVGHSAAPNESSRLDELHTAVRFYRHAMERFCL